MSRLDSELERELEVLRRAGLARTTAPPAGGADFASNDTLGLARHPEDVEAARRAAREHGGGGRAERPLGGGSPHDERGGAGGADGREAQAAAALACRSRRKKSLPLMYALRAAGLLPPACRAVRGAGR